MRILPPRCFRLERHRFSLREMGERPPSCLLFSLFPLFPSHFKPDARLFVFYLSRLSFPLPADEEARLQHSFLINMRFFPTLSAGAD